MQIAVPRALDKWLREPTAPVAHEPSARTQTAADEYDALVLKILFMNFLQAFTYYLLINEYYL